MEQLPPGPPIPEPHAAASQMILALPVAHLDNCTSTEHVLGMWTLWETKWEMTD